jgi:hypothetical protein
MTYWRRMRFVLFAVAFVVLPYIRLALGAESDIPSISIPPEARYLALQVTQKYHAFCKDRENCIPEIVFVAATGDGHSVMFVWSMPNVSLTITDDVGPAIMDLSGRFIIVKTVRRTISLSSDGKIRAMNEEVSDNGFVTVKGQSPLLWDQAIVILDFADQFIGELLKSH